MKKKKLKRIIIISSVITVLTVTSVFAYFMSRDNRVDSYRIKNNSNKTGVRIYEQYSEGDLMPADEVEKNLQIENIANYEQFIRVRITPTFKDAPKLTEGATADNNLIQLSFKNLAANIESASEGQWIKGNDGYYYYIGKVQEGGFTSELLNSFTLHIDTNNQYEGAAFDLEVTAEAVQAKNDVILKSWAETDTNILNKINSYKDNININNVQIMGTVSK